MKDLLLVAYLAVLHGLKRLTTIERGAVKCITLVVAMTVVTTVYASTNYVSVSRVGVGGSQQYGSPGASLQPTGGIYDICNFTPGAIRVGGWFVNGCAAQQAFSNMTVLSWEDPSAPDWCVRHNAWDIGQNRPVLYAWCSTGEPFVYCNGVQAVAGCQ